MLSQLESLPTEIQAWLLCWLTDIPSLMSLLGASPVFLQVYRANRNSIYTNVVCNHIGTGFLSAALVTLKLRKLDEPVDVNIFQNLVGDFEHKHDLVDISTMSIQDTKQLFRFHRFLDELAQSFAKESLLFLRSCMTLETLNSAEIDVNLSPSESYRILRGLYNWELISIICQHYMEASRINASRATQLFDCLKRLLNMFVVHELGEIYFVQYFFRERLSRFINQAEDDRFEEFIDRGPGYPHFIWEADADDFFFTSVLRDRQDKWINTMLWSRDIQALSHILSLSTPADRLDFIEDTDSLVIEHQNPLAEELEHRQRPLLSVLTSSAIFADWKVPIKAPFQHRLGKYEEHVRNTNLGLLWSHSETQRSLSFDLFNKISGLGLVIWDKSRLQTMDVFSSKWDFLIHSDKKSFFVMRRKKPSVEERARKQELEWETKSKSST